MTTTTKKAHEQLDKMVEVESAWNEELQTLKATIRIYFPPTYKSYRPRAQRPGKVKIYSKEEIAALKGTN